METKDFYKVKIKEEGSVLAAIKTSYFHDAFDVISGQLIPTHKTGDAIILDENLNLYGATIQDRGGALVALATYNVNSNNLSKEDKIIYKDLCMLKEEIRKFLSQDRNCPICNDKLNVHDWRSYQLEKRKKGLIGIINVRLMCYHGQTGISHHVKEYDLTTGKSLRLDGKKESYKDKILWRNSIETFKHFFHR